MFHRYLFLAMMSAYKRRTCPLLQTCNNFEQRKNKFYRVHAMAALIFVKRIAYREITRQNIFSNIFSTADRPFFFSLPRKHLTESKDYLREYSSFAISIRHLPLLFLLSFDGLENPIGTEFTCDLLKMLRKSMKCLFLTDCLKQHLTPLFTY